MAESSVIGLLRVLLTADTAEFGTAMGRATKDLDKTGKQAKNTEKDVAGLTKGMAGLVGALDQTSGGLSALAGSANPAAMGLSKISGTVTGLVSGFTALGPVGAAAALGIGALTAGAVAAVAAVVGVTAGIISLTKSAADAGDALFTLSNKTGISVEALSGFQFVAEQTDTSVDDITGSITRLGRNLAENAPKTVKAIKDIGLSITDIRKQRPEDAFQSIITGLSKIPDAGKRSAAGFAIFGKQFTSIAQLTREDMGGLMQSARDMGLVMSTEFAVAGDRFNDAINVIQKNVSALTAKLGAEFLPVAIAFVETFGAQFTAAMTTAGKGAGGLSATVAEVAIAVGQAFASIIEVGAPVVKFLTEFFAGAFIANLGLVDLFAKVLGAVATLAGVMGSFDPVLAAVAVRAKEAAAGLSAFAERGAIGTAQVAGAIGAYADAVGVAAKRTREELPGAVDKVRASITEQAKAMRDAQAAAGGFGAELGENAEANKAAAKAAEAHRKELERLDDLLAKRGVLSVTAYSTKLGELVEVLNLAARVGTPALQTAVAALWPEFVKLSKAAKDSGQDVAAVAGVMRDFAQMAGLDDLVATMTAWETANLGTTASMGGILAALPQLSVVTEGAALDAQILTDAYHEFGQQTPLELRKAADAAVFYYNQLRASGTASTAQLTLAHQQMVAAINAANQKIPSMWETVILPRVTAVVDNLTANVSRGFAAMLTGAASFKEGFLSIWDSIKSAVLDILAEILDAFIKTFLRGMLNALAGQKGGLMSAFANFAGGSGGSGGGGGGAAGWLSKIPGLGFMGGGGALASSTAIPGGTMILGPGGVPMATGGAGGAAAGGGLMSSPLVMYGGGAAAGAAVGYGVGYGSGNAAGGIAAGAGTGAGVGFLLGGPIGAGIGAGVGALAGWYGAQKARKEANDFRDEFFSQVGEQLGGFQPGAGEGSTFNKVAAMLTEAGQGPGGGQLFQDLIKANDAEELAQAIERVNAVIGPMIEKEKEAATAEQAHQAEIAKTNAALEEKRKVITDQIKTLDDELAGIERSEAPEEHMGTVEKRARERIAAEKKALEQQLAEVAASFVTVADKAGDAANQTLDATLAALRAKLSPEEAAALAAGYQQAVNEGFKGSQDEFLAQQVTFYQTLEEGDERLKTFFTTNTREMFDAMTAAGYDWRDAFQGNLDEAAAHAGDFFLATRDAASQSGDDIADRFRTLFQHDIPRTWDGLPEDAADAGRGIVDQFEESARRVREALAGLGRNVPTIRIPVEYERPPGDALLSVPGHALGGVFDRPHLAAIAEGGEPEIVGSVPFMSRALAGALDARQGAIAAHQAATAGRSVSITINIDAVDGASVERLVRSSEFRTSLTQAIKGNNPPGFRTDIRDAAGITR